ncbi:MAG: hypothetical protein WCD68_07510, partial [Candidatus Acidiferrum sp.]
MKLHGTLPSSANRKITKKFARQPGVMARELHESVTLSVLETQAHAKASRAAGKKLEGQQQSFAEETPMDKKLPSGEESVNAG